MNPDKTMIFFYIFILCLFSCNALESGFYVDSTKNQVYFVTINESVGIEKRLLEADAKTFVISDYIHTSKVAILGYDKDNVYIRWKIIPNFKSSGLEKIHDNYYKNVDGYWYYYDGSFTKIPVVDPASFNVIDEQISACKSGVYYFGNIIVGANPLSFKKLFGGYSTDGEYFFHLTSVIKEADFTTFKVIIKFSNFASDCNHVYFCGKIVEKADPKTFRPTSRFSGVDDENSFVYDRSQKMVVLE